MSVLETHRMRDLVRDLNTKSAKIRALGDAGFERTDIARFLNVRYQHVRNVLVGPRPKQSNADRATRGSPIRHPDAKGDLLKAPAGLKARVQIGAGGRVVIPAEMRTFLNVSEGDTLVARIVDGELRLLSQDAAIRKVQSMVRRYVPEGTSLVDELLSDRREEARREAEE